MTRNSFVKLMFILTLFLSVATLVSAQQVRDAAPAPKGTWQYLGTTTVGYNADRDVIKVEGADTFRKLKFMVHDAKLEIYDMDVIFENGGHQDIQVRSTIERGGESRVIDLNGESRRIVKVAFVYRTVPGFNFEKTKVSLWGEK